MKVAHKVLIGTLAMSLVLAGCKVETTMQPTDDNGAATQQVKQTTAPTTAIASKRDIVGYRLMQGVLYLPAEAQANVMTTGSAPIQDILVKIGDHVSRGQTMMTLASGQAANYAQAKSTYDAALAAYNQALAQYEQPVKDAQRQLDQARSTERTVRDTTTPGGDASALQQANATRSSLEDALKQAKAQATTSELPYKQQLDTAKASMDDAKAGKNSAKVTAPISGTVMTLTTASGQQPSPQTPVANIVDLRAFSVKAAVSPDDAPFVKTGTPVVIMFNELQNHVVNGRVRSVTTIPASSDGKPGYTATIDFNNEDGTVKPKMTIHSVGVVSGKRSGVVAVPIDAVGKDSSGKPVVKVLDHGNWKPVTVEPGLSDGYYVEIKSGVESGDSVQVVPGQGNWLMGTNLTTTPAS